MIEVPAQFAANQERIFGDMGRAWIARLPDLASEVLDRWRLAVDGEARHGYVGLVLPVRRDDGMKAALKLHPIDPSHWGESAALKTWAGDAAVRLLDEHQAEDTSILLLERLEADKSLLTVREDAAIAIIKDLLTRLNAHKASAEIQRLDDVVANMLAYAPEAVTKLADSREQLQLIRWADAVNDLGPSGDRLLHWDLHYENVLAADREPWLAIDPKPLAGDPAFELLPALHNRWDEAVASGDLRRTLRRRFDQLSEGMDRDHAVAWTLARVLQNSLWTIEDGDVRLEAEQMAVADAIA